MTDENRAKIRESYAEDNQNPDPAPSEQGEELGYWWCPECEEEVDSHRVTFQECHDTCGRHVIWKEPLAARLAQSPTPSTETRLREIAKEVSDWQVQSFAGAPYECLFCGKMKGAHDDDCISLKARAALKSEDKP